MHQGIGYASSSDGKNWSKDAGNPIFHITDGVPHRATRVYTPAVIDDGSGSLKMYYSAQATCADPKTIGLATLQLPPPSVGGTLELRGVGSGSPGSDSAVPYYIALAAAAAIAIAAGAWYLRRQWVR